MSKKAIVLAAGKGTRMKSSLYKVLHPVLGKSMVNHVVDNLKAAEVNDITIVVGYGAEVVMQKFDGDVEFVLQEKQLGTGHAVVMAKELMENESGQTIVICGDTPLISKETIENLFKYHNENSAAATVMTSVFENPFGYGRVIRDNDNNVEKIVEHKDASEEELKVNEINTATYIFDNKLLFQNINKLQNNNVQGEYYLTDMIGILKAEGHKVAAYINEDKDESLGVNDRVALAEAERILKTKINKTHMLNGVSIIDPLNTYISIDTQIGTDTIIYPGTVIYGKNIIGSDCVIGPNCHFENVEIGNNNNIKHSVITDSKVGSNNKIGPFAHFRNGTFVRDNVRIGNFVELKKTEFKDNSNAAHLSYLGDASIGENVNIGCGSITVNYDGKNKYKTTIEDNVFVGCNSNLIAPITIKEGAYIAAGSTINKDVNKEDLAIARAKQVNKEGYARKFK